jgi:hypothetical protein
MLFEHVGAVAQQQVVGAPPEASNMKLVGANDLQARSAYQPTIHHQGDRWIAYIGHHGGTDDIPAPVNPQTGKAEPNGTSIVDVTDPAQPKYLRHIPGQPGTYEAGGAQMVRICDGKALPKGDRNAVYMLRTFGGEAHEIWNVADPANPGSFLGESSAQAVNDAGQIAGDSDSLRRQELLRLRARSVLDFTRWGRAVHRSNEAITAAGERLNEHWSVR